MNLITLITQRIDSFGHEDDFTAAAKFFGVSKTKIQKWYAGTESPSLTAGQKIIDEEIAAGRVIIPAFSGQALATTKAPEPEKPKLEIICDPEPAAHAVATDAAALVNMTPEELEHELRTCLRDMPNDNRYTLLKLLAEGIERRVAICLPTHSDINPSVFHSILGLSKNLRVANLLQSKDTLIHRARNLLAEQFLATGAEWSLWVDADMMVPFGDGRWFKARTGKKDFPDWAAKLNAIQRLTSHGDRTIVGGVYAARSTSNRLIIAPDLDPSGDDDQMLVKRIKEVGPEDKLVPVPWVAFGLVAVHRNVFEDIKQQMPELAPKKKGAPFNFFSMTDGETADIGEDKLFCLRAAKCGHQSSLDLAIHAAHIGNYAFMP